MNTEQKYWLVRDWLSDFGDPDLCDDECAHSKMICVLNEDQLLSLCTELLVDRNFGGWSATWHVKIHESGKDAKEDAQARLAVLRRGGRGVPHDEAESTSGDVTIDWNGSVFLFTPRSSRVREWMTENADSEQQWWRGALVVEWRYARDVASIMRESGLAVTPVNRTAAEAYDSLPQ